MSVPESIIKSRIISIINDYHRSHQMRSEYESKPTRDSINEHCAYLDQINPEVRLGHSVRCSLDILGRDIGIRLDSDSLDKEVSKYERLILNAANYPSFPRRPPSLAEEKAFIEKQIVKVYTKYASKLRYFKLKEFLVLAKDVIDSQEAYTKDIKEETLPKLIESTNYLKDFISKHEALLSLERALSYLIRSKRQVIELSAARSSRSAHPGHMVTPAHAVHLVALAQPPMPYSYPTHVLYTAAAAVGSTEVTIIPTLDSVRSRPETFFVP